MANRLKGEVEVELFGKKFTLRPDIESICEIEDAADGYTSVPKMWVRTAKGTLGFKETALVIYGCLRGQGVKDYALSDVLKEIRKRGVANYVIPALTLIRVMCTPDEAEAELAAEADAKKEEPKVEKLVTASTG